MIEINEILKKEKTPFYVFDLTKVEERIKYLREHLPTDVELCYAVKANTFISKKASELVDRLEICSPGEYRICHQLNLPSKQFVISGVNKERDFIEDLISKDLSIGYYTVESKLQFELLINAARQNNRQIDILLRLSSGNQFGLDESDLEEIVQNYKNDPFVSIKGIQFFSGTQKNSLKKLQRELEYVDSFMEQLESKLQYSFQELEFGPGFPVMYFKEDSFDEDAFLLGFSDLLKSLRFKGKISLELGRSIAASCGTYFTSVVDIKQTRNEGYAIVDGGMHQLVYYGQFMAMKHPKLYLLPERSGEEMDWNICGSLCTSNDILVKKLPLPSLKIGDTLAFCNTGAYCMIEGISLFLSRDLPKVLLYDGTDYITARSRFDTYVLNTLEKIKK